MSVETVAIRRSRMEQLALHPHTPVQVKDRIERILSR